jgi:cathepsin L
MSLFLLGVLLCGVDASSRSGADEAKFAAFIQKHGRTYAAESDEYSMRFSLFQKHLAAAEEHNSQPHHRWTAGVTSLADRLPTELAMLRGYRRSSSQGSRTGVLGLASISVRTVNVNHLPKNFTWKGKLKAMDHVVNQGGCGSCWAVSSATALRAHAELHRSDRTFSAQQLVECTPNPQACGGQGGCTGATSELAMQYAVDAGLATEDEYAYSGVQHGCPAGMQVQPNQRSTSFLDSSSHKKKGGVAMGLTGWQKLPENKMKPLLLAVYETGPAVVSVAATFLWNMYEDGIMDSCPKESVVNHAVVLVGFGQDRGRGYWDIQNSWGDSWGMGGFIHLLRTDDDDAHCAWDNKPEDGTACKGGPPRVWVCGSCGVLYDSVTPSFAPTKDGFLSRHTRTKDGHFLPTPEMWF